MGEHALAPRKYERHVSRVGGTSGGLGRGGHTREVWCKIAIEGGHAPGACWVWRGYTDKDGYGKMTVAGPRTVRAHRWLWEQERNALARGEILVNLCGNRACVNPSHKKAGQQVDAIRNGKRGEPADNRGELSPCAKLTEDDVLFIRSQEAVYGLIPVLARLFGVATVTVVKIRAGSSWKHMRRRKQEALAMPLAQLRGLVAQREGDAYSIEEAAASRPGAT